MRSFPDGVRLVRMLLAQQQTSDAADSSQAANELTSVFGDNPIGDILGTNIFTLDGTQVSVASVVVVVVLMVITWVVSRLVQRALARALVLRHPEEENANAEQAMKTTNRLLHYAIVVIGFAISLSVVGIKLNAVFAAGAVFAVGFGFAVQNVVENFVSGLLLLFERSIRPGDVLELDGKLLRVRDVRVRTTIAESLDGDETIIPNSQLAQGRVQNQSLHDRRQRVRVGVGVSHDSDPDEVFRVLVDAATSFPQRAKSRDPLVLLQDLGASSIQFEVFVWIGDAWATPRVRSALRRDIWSALRDHHIRIAHPQLDLHLPDGNGSELKSPES